MPRAAAAASQEVLSIYRAARQGDPGFVGLACTVGKLTVGEVTKPMPEIWLQRRRYRHGLRRH
jgi:hypothetical protein